MDARMHYDTHEYLSYCKNTDPIILNTLTF